MRVQGLSHIKLPSLVSRSMVYISQWKQCYCYYKQNRPIRWKSEVQNSKQVPDPTMRSQTDFTPPCAFILSEWQRSINNVLNAENQPEGLDAESSCWFLWNTANRLGDWSDACAWGHLGGVKSSVQHSCITRGILTTGLETSGTSISL